MSVSYALTKLSIPPGFEHLLEGLTREVLREQPSDIIQFAARYFKTKLDERQVECGHKSNLPAHSELKTEVKSYSLNTSDDSTPVANSPTANNALEKPHQYHADINNLEEHRAASVIQSTFRKHLAQKRVGDDSSATEGEVVEDMTKPESSTNETTFEHGQLQVPTEQEREETSTPEEEREIETEQSSVQERGAAMEDGHIQDSAPEGSVTEGSINESSLPEHSRAQEAEGGIGERDPSRESAEQLDDEAMSEGHPRGSTADVEGMDEPERTAMDDTGGEMEDDQDTDTNQSITDVEAQD